MLLSKYEQEPQLLSEVAASWIGHNRFVLSVCVCMYVSENKKILKEWKYVKNTEGPAWNGSLKPNLGLFGHQNKIVRVKNYNSLNKLRAHDFCIEICTYIHL